MSEYTAKKDGDTFRALQFVNLARDTGKIPDSRFPLHLIKIEQGAMAASDGHRLHVVTVDHNLAPGSYEIIKSTKSSIFINQVKDSDFPDYRPMLAGIDKREERVFRLFATSEMYQPYTEIVRAMLDTTTASHSYIFDALTEAKYAFTVDGDGPIHLYSIDKMFQAIVMPAVLR